MDYKKVYEEWLANPYFDEATKEELRAIEGDEKETSNAETLQIHAVFFPAYREFPASEGFFPVSRFCGC